MFPVTLPWLKAVVREFSFTRMLPSIHGFWFGNHCYGNDIFNALSNELTHRISVFVNVVVGPNAEHINPRGWSSLEAWNQIGRTSVEQTWARELPVLGSVYRLGATKWSRGQLFRKEGGAGPFTSDRLILSPHQTILISMLSLHILNNICVKLVLI